MAAALAEQACTVVRRAIQHVGNMYTMTVTVALEPVPAAAARPPVVAVACSGATVTARAWPRPANGSRGVVAVVSWPP